MRTIRSVVLVLFSVACAALSVGAGAASASTTASIDAVRVVGPLPAKPQLQFAKPFSVRADTKRVIERGTGAIATEGQRATVRFLAVNGRTGTAVRTSYGWNPANVVLDATDENRLLVDAITGTAVGSRVLVAAPSKDPFAQGLTGAKALKRGDSVLLVVDLVDLHTPLAVATGTPGSDPLPGMPTVVDHGAAAPGVTIPPGNPLSTDLQVATLVKGTGPKVDVAQNVLVNYEGIVWRSGQTFDSTWRLGHPVTVPIGVGQVITGWENGLIGQTVGSRVLLVVPPEQAYGTNGNRRAGIEPGDTLVFVIDVLDTWA